MGRLCRTQCLVAKFCLLADAATAESCFFKMVVPGGVDWKTLYADWFLNSSGQVLCGPGGCYLYHTSDEAISAFIRLTRGEGAERCFKQSAGVEAGAGGGMADSSGSDSDS